MRVCSPGEEENKEEEKGEEENKEMQRWSVCLSLLLYLEVQKGVEAAAEEGGERLRTKKGGK